MLLPQALLLFGFIFKLISPLPTPLSTESVDAPVTSNTRLNRRSTNALRTPSYKFHPRYDVPGLTIKLRQHGLTQVKKFILSSMFDTHNWPHILGLLMSNTSQVVSLSRPSRVKVLLTQHGLNISVVDVSFDLNMTSSDSSLLRTCVSEGFSVLSVRDATVAMVIKPSIELVKNSADSTDTVTNSVVMKTNLTHLHLTIKKSPILKGDHSQTRLQAACNTLVNGGMMVTPIVKRFVSNMFEEQLSQPIPLEFFDDIRKEAQKMDVDFEFENTKVYLTENTLSLTTNVKNTPLKEERDHDELERYFQSPIKNIWEDGMSSSKRQERLDSYRRLFNPHYVRRSPSTSLWQRFKSRLKSWWNRFTCSRFRNCDQQDAAEQTENTIKEDKAVIDDDDNEIFYDALESFPMEIPSPEVPKQQASLLERLSAPFYKFKHHLVKRDELTHSPPVKPLDRKKIVQAVPNNNDDDEQLIRAVQSAFAAMTPEDWEKTTLRFE